MSKESEIKLQRGEIRQEKRNVDAKSIGQEENEERHPGSGRDMKRGSLSIFSKVKWNILYKSERKGSIKQSLHAQLS